MLTSFDSWAGCLVPRSRGALRVCLAGLSLELVCLQNGARAVRLEVEAPIPQPSFSVYLLCSLGSYTDLRASVSSYEMRVLCLPPSCGKTNEIQKEGFMNREALSGQPLREGFQRPGPAHSETSGGGTFHVFPLQPA